FKGYAGAARGSRVTLGLNVAAGQGKYGALRERVCLKPGRPAPGEGDVFALARDAGLDMEAFAKDMASPGKGQDATTEGAAEAMHVSVAPWRRYFVNGRVLAEGTPLWRMEEAIDAELARARAALESGVPRKRLYAELTKDVKFPWEEQLE